MEGKDAGRGSGSWPRTPRFAVGDEVEVLFTGSGFRGARFEATVTARFPDSRRYEVVYSELIVRRDGPPLREVVGVSELRPRPPPPQPGREFELFDLVEAYNNDGWWPGVVSDIRPKRRRNQAKRFAMSLPLFREVLELSASFVRPRREFVYGSWIDAQEVLRGIPQYAEGSRVEVMCDKQGRVWRPATIKNMVGGTNYVVSYGNGQSSIEVLHTMFIRRPEPIQMEVEAPKDSNQMEIKNERMGMSLVVAERFHLETCTNSNDITIVSSQPLQPVSEKSPGPSSLLHPVVMADTSAFMALAVPNSSDLSTAFSTTSLLLMPNDKMEVFQKLPQIPHFREAWNCPPELREGRALGLMVCFANMAKSIKDMRIQEEPRLYQEKMSILLEMEENGFETAPLKVRLHNLLCTRNHHMNLKSRKVRLEKEILEIEAINCGLEQRLKFLDMCIMGMEEKKYQEMKGSLDIQKTENCSLISKLQVYLCQVEESLKYAEADFCSIATAPWQPHAVPSIA